MSLRRNLNQYYKTCHYPQINPVVQSKYIKFQKGKIKGREKQSKSRSHVYENCNIGKSIFPMNEDRNVDFLCVGRRREEILYSGNTLFHVI